MDCIRPSRSIPIKEESTLVDIASNFKRELSKLAYLRAKFAHLDPKTTHFFISNTQNNLATIVFDPSGFSQFAFTGDGHEELHEELNRYFGEPTQMTTVTTAGRSNDSIGKLVSVRLLDSDESEWVGNDIAWNTLLREVCGR